MFENEKKGWLMKTFQNLGHSITPEGAEFFLEMVENTTDVLKNEASRVSLFLGQGAEVTLEKLESFLDHSAGKKRSSPSSTGSSMTTWKGLWKSCEKSSFPPAPARASGS
jgi:hypothetical protein